MLTLLCTLVLLFFAFWLVVLLGVWTLIAVAETGATIRTGLAWLAQGLAYLFPQIWIPLLLGIGPFALLAVALLH
jgi:hypothetical protein